MKYMIIQINDIPDNEFIIEELKRYLECKIDTTLKLLNDRHRLYYEMYLYRDPYSNGDMWCEIYEDLEDDYEDI